MNISKTQEMENTGCLRFQPSFRDEDYIVFCFKEDGDFNVVKEKESEPSNTLECRTVEQHRMINRKLIYGDHERDVDQNSQDPTWSEDEADFDQIDEKESDDKDGESIYFDPESPSSGMREEGNEDYVSTTLESSISTQSDGSTSSFAFPVLRWEWSGSPAKMPKSEGMHLRKHRAWRLGLYCCRF